jgi:O-acetyl-ADP-ribose deacetylase (regulator of RNase III)
LSLSLQGALLNTAKALPRNPAAQIAVGEVTAFLEKPSPLNEVIFCVFDDDTHAIYEALLS